MRLGEAFRQAVEAGVRPCTVSFTAVISAFAKIGVPWAAPVWAVTEATGDRSPILRLHLEEREVHPQSTENWFRSGHG